MRVFCHEHKRGFFAPRQSPIKCENRGHVLGELDFAGGGKSALQLQWQYCCNCEHFCVIDFDQNGLQRCPVCTRRSSTLYLCDRCYTISFESNTPLQTKNFTLTSEGIPQPCCPGCLQPASADIREHTCEVIDASFVTGLNSCPICEERLDIGPAFPSPVAQYLRRTKSANKVNVTFDYENGLFVAVEDGEFVLISTREDTRQTIVLPRSPRLTSPRDFYELYQDYYRCAAPDQGEINITEPAVVVPTPDGWKFLSPGILVVVNDQPKKKTPVAMPAQPSEPPMREEPRHSGLERTDSATVCAQCETLIEAKYAFCWKCGYPREGKNRTSEDAAQHRLKSVPNDRPERSRLIVSAMDEDDEAQTVQYESKAGRPPVMSWLTGEAPKQQTRASRSVLKLFAIPAAGLLLLSLTLFALSRSNSTLTAAAPTEASESSEQTGATPAVTPAVEMKTASLRSPTTDVEDSALEQLRKMRQNADDPNPARILKNISETEKKYADDYRFPYERAKVVVKDHKKNFHKEAFAALARAAQKAINKGKAGEMLQNLRNDSVGDFQELSHGHREWAQLQRALKSKDASVLSANEGL